MIHPYAKSFCRCHFNPVKSVTELSQCKGAHHWQEMRYTTIKNSYMFRTLKSFGQLKFNFPVKYSFGDLSGDYIEHHDQQ